MTAPVSAPVVRAPVRLVDIELSDPIVDISTDREDARPAVGVRALIRLHGIPIGLVDARPTGNVVSGDDLAGLVEERLADAIRDHLCEDGDLPSTDAHATTAASRPAERWTAVREPSATVPTCRVRPVIGSDPPSLTVVIPTRDRAERALACVRSVIANGYPHIEILVVDNAPSSDETERAFADAALPDVRYLREPRAGTSRARNLGLREAAGELVGFLDDDVLVDELWAAALVQGFAVDPEVDCVTGPIVAAELETEAQVLIEEYGGFDKGFTRRVFDPASPPAGAPLLPYIVGTLGSGANMAFRRGAILGLGGFDVALGGGTTSRGGEDLAAFLGILLGGSRLAYEPSMLVRHYHHRSYAQLRRVLFGYGMGLGAYLARTMITDPRHVAAIGRRLPRGVAYMFDPGSPKNAKRRSDYPRELMVREWLGLALGPVAYATARLRMVRRGGDHAEPELRSG